MDNPNRIPTINLHRMLGAIALPDSRTRFCVWAPTMDRVSVHLIDQRRQVPMNRYGEYYAAEIDNVQPGDRYLLQFGDSPPRPDPTSRYQPEGVHGPSQIVSRRFDWSDQSWQGISTDRLIIYELHVGTFTGEGTFASAVDRIDELVDLGITAIEIMPVADAAGRWNWGYDGVCLFAPNHNYGSPDDLRRLVDTAHAKGLSVILDVVYNHLGPEGNYLGEAGPYLSTRHTTAWGAAPNFDDPDYGRNLRRFFVANAIYWFDEYHVDALRIDAIHCMRDDSEPHIAAEISEAVKHWSQSSGREGKLIAESNVYDPVMLSPIDQDGIGFDAEWCDDFLHSVFAVVRPGEQLCHRRYEPGVDLDQTMTYGYVYEGTLRNQRGRRTPVQRVNTSNLIYSIQNHDFIGNHPRAQRLHQLTSLRTQRAAAALLLLSPAIPMLFMGEEFACPRPFQFFVDFSDESLRQAVLKGRRSEYPQHDWSTGKSPTAPEVFAESKIGAAEDGDLSMRRWYQALIAVRKAWQRDGLLDNANLAVINDVDAGIFQMRYSTNTAVATVAARLVAVDEDDGSRCRLDCPGDLVLNSDGCDQSGIAAGQAKVFLKTQT